MHAWHTFLSDETLASCRQSYHDDTYPCVFSLDAHSVSFPAWPHKIAGGHSAHIWGEDAFGLGLGVEWCASARWNQGWAKLGWERVYKKARMRNRIGS